MYFKIKAGSNHFLNEPEVLETFLAVLFRESTLFWGSEPTIEPARPDV